MQLNLLEKTELRIYGLRLQSVNLSVIGARVADVLSLPKSQVLVVDVRDDHVCLDILAKSLDIQQVIGKENELMESLSGIDGLTLKHDAYVDSDGILGLIHCGEADSAAIVNRTQAIMNEVEQAVLRRATVYATGFEVQSAMIKDTNSPFLTNLLSEQGYLVEFGGVLEDDASVIAHRLRDSAERGIGLVVTTGGVGAEDKDFTVEALTKIDADAATPWLVKFQAGVGRHFKEGVRIGVAQYGLTTFISLPGPHEEVVAVAAALRSHCTLGRIAKQALATDIAEILREKLRNKYIHHH